MALLPSGGTHQKTDAREATATLDPLVQPEMAEQPAATHGKAEDHEPASGGKQELGSGRCPTKMNPASKSVHVATEHVRTAREAPREHVQDLCTCVVCGNAAAIETGRAGRMYPFPSSSLSKEFWHFTQQQRAPNRKEDPS
uniref:Uncharacterized protein n=1 Tax=Sphaerodactylus townsendi TaxID=933632 RepID=A0ACB8E7U2_9SAUR